MVNRAKRLNPRFPFDQEVAVRVRDQDSRATYRARDISLGGLFVATDDALEIFSEVDVELLTPEGDLLKLPARVVHVISSAKAAQCGIPAGMGLQLDDLAQPMRLALGRVIEHARAHDPRKRVPRPIASPDKQALKDEPMLSYVLGGVDGRRTPESLANALALDLDQTEEMLTELVQRGLVELVSAISPQHAARAESSQIKLKPDRALKGRAQPADKQASNAVLSPQVKQEVDRLWQSIDGLTHYEVLGTVPQATSASIREAYFKLSRELHPDLYRGKPLGSYGPKLEQIFARLSEAYGVLSRERSRAE